MKRLIVLIFAAAFAFYAVWPAYSGYQIHSALQAGDTAALESKIDFPSVRASMRDPVLAHVDTRMASAIKTYGPLANMIGSKIPKDKMEGLVDGALADAVNADGLVRIYASGGDMSSEIQRSLLKQIDKMGGVMALLGGGKKLPGASTESSGESGGGGLGGVLGGLKLPGGLGKVLGGAGAGAAGGLVGDVIGKAVGNIDTVELAKKLFPALGGGSKRNAASSDDGAGAGGSVMAAFDHVKSFGFAGPLGMQLGVAQSKSAAKPDVTAQINFQDFDWKVTKLTPHL